MLPERFAQSSGDRAEHRCCHTWDAAILDLRGSGSRVGCQPGLLLPQSRGCPRATAPSAGLVLPSPGWCAHSAHGRQGLCESRDSA